MQNSSVYEAGNKKETFNEPVTISPAALNMIGVILFYVIVFVAVNVFTGQI